MQRDALITATTQFLAVASSFVLTVIAARSIPINEFAALSWALSWALLLGVLAGFGTGQSSVVLGAQAGRPGEVSFLPSLLRLSGLASALVVAAWLLVAGPLTAAATDEPQLYRSVLIAVAIWIPTAGFSALIGGLMRGLGWFARAAPISEYLRRTILIVLLLASPALWPDASIGNVLIVGALIEFAAVLGSGIWLWLQVAPRAKRFSNPVTRQAVFALSSRFVFPTIVATTIPQSTIWIAALFNDSSGVALLSVAIRFSLVLYVPQALGLRVFAPRIAARSAERDLSALEPQLRAFSTIASAAVIALGLGFAFGGKVFLTEVLGEEFTDAYPMTMIFVLAAIANSVTGLSGAVLSHSGYADFTNRVAIGTMVSFVALGLALSPVGAVGWAAASAVVMASSNVVVLVAMQRRLGISTLPTIHLVQMVRHLRS